MLINAIEINKVYINKTWKYLFPITKSYGELYKLRMENLWKLGAGIGDSFYPKDHPEAIFIVVDRIYFPNKYQNTITWLRQQKFYIDDYPMDNILTGRMQMIVIKFPQKMLYKYKLFFEGRYSEMFTSKEIDFYFRKDDETRKEVIDILERKLVAKQIFIEKVKNSFNTLLTVSDLATAELDFPPMLKYETFNLN